VPFDRKSTTIAFLRSVLRPRLECEEKDVLIAAPTACRAKLTHSDSYGDQPTLHRS